jgi:hypothetical protein
VLGLRTTCSWQRRSRSALNCVPAAHHVSGRHSRTIREEVVPTDATSPPTPDGERWAGEYASNNGARAHVRSRSVNRLVTLGYITSVALPLIGLVLGIVIAVRPPRKTRRHGAWIIALSIVASVVWVLVLTSGIMNTQSTGSY